MPSALYIIFIFADWYGCHGRKVYRGEWVIHLICMLATKVLPKFTRVVTKFQSTRHTTILDQ